ncbi:TMEM199/VMA12 family vacuolar ATPase assembly factor [Metabacillus litoralis]|uniref:TMEM199/VMA12 family vacuolar ATPase assembly factor n=1 Tax=Metabacillus litoralis TaxID=152268 RepID=UPI001CFE2AC7|nr:TMEM199/VMA12 family vacuolar ATPase assembly factor [Metabacillus litoralis]
MNKRMTTIIMTMIFVAILSLWILAKDHSAVPLHFRILIAIGGSLLSGVLAYFLSIEKNDAEKSKSNK